MKQEMLDRATYKKIKSMTREEIWNFQTNYYHNVMDESRFRKTQIAKKSKRSDYTR